MYFLCGQVLKLIHRLFCFFGVPRLYTQWIVCEKNLSVSPLLQSSIGELQKWDGHAQSLQSVRDCFDTHWPETKASLVADNKWDVLQI